MPISIQKMMANTAKITLYIGEDDVNIVYHPARVTEEFMAQVLAFDRMDAETFEATFTSFNASLAEIIESWDVFDGETMFPLDATQFKRLSLSFRFSVAQAIMSDIRPEVTAPQEKTRN